jgi:hypothetical protein
VNPVRIDDALPDGIAAELVAWLPRLPLGVETAPAGAGVWWGCELELPPVPDAQTPACLIALMRFFARDVPARIADHGGGAVVREKPSRFALRLWRKGSFVEEGPLGAPGTIHAIVGLTAARWPAAWGGALELLDHDLALAPGFGTLDLVAGDARRRVPLVTHHVIAMTAYATYLASA